MALQSSLKRSVLQSLREQVYPSIPEQLPVAYLRRLGLRFALLALVVSATGLVLTLYELTRPDAQTPALVVYLALNIPPYKAAIGLNLWAARNLTDASSWRRIATTTILLFVWSGVVAIWLHGSTSVTVPVLLAVFGIIIYRVLYDGRIGAVALVSTVGLHVGLVLLEQHGLVPHGPLADGVGASNLSVRGVLSAIVLVYVVAWYGAGASADRFRADENDARDSRREPDSRDEAFAGEAATRGPLSGKIFAGRYELHELCGRGGMGEVYRGVVIDSGEPVAVKVLLPELARSSTAIKRFKREADIAARVAEGHAPRVLEVGLSDEGQPFLAMEFLHGEDLDALIARRKLGSEEAVALVSKVASALEAAHAHGIVHRDLKPSNVFLRRTEVCQGPDVLLLDFGIARLFEGEVLSSLTVNVVGTPGYLAPEQARGDHAALGPHTDVFALGAVAFEALTRRRAFQVSNGLDGVFQALYMEPPRASLIDPSLPAEVDEVLALALAKEPVQRYKSPLEFARDLEDALGGRLSSATRERAASLRLSRAPNARPPLRTELAVHED